MPALSPWRCTVCDAIKDIGDNANPECAGCLPEPPAHIATKPQGRRPKPGSRLWNAWKLRDWERVAQLRAMGLRCDARRNVAGSIRMAQIAARREAGEKKLASGFVPSRVRELLAAYYQQEYRRRATARLPLTTIWTDLARSTGISRGRLDRAMRGPGSNWDIPRRDRVALARATGTPESAWLASDAPMDEGLLLHEREEAVTRPGGGVERATASETSPEVSTQQSELRPGTREWREESDPS
jgi:hypothetical protein